MIDVFLLLGSNLGERGRYLELAVIEIERLVGRIEKRSTIHQTPAWGKTDEPDYLNQVLLVKTNLKPLDILHTALAIEKSLGRIRKEKWGSRTIDIDILFYGDEIINQPELTVPHPQLHKRKFTLAPMTEIAPDFVHPVLGKSIGELNGEAE
jgi:2-amino-4-hydroxy-6-hydroxymethyldihydropteridine diphosphokinase